MEINEDRDVMNDIVGVHYMREGPNVKIVKEFDERTLKISSLYMRKRINIYGKE